MHLLLTFAITLCCFSQIFSSPTPAVDSTCPPCTWTDWFNVDHPNDDPNSGDWETLKNITARGFDVCRAPRDISCRSVRFPYVPYKFLMYNTTCDKSTGLTCLNKKNSESPCIDFEVQFLCCPCDKAPEPTNCPGSEIPTSPEQSTTQVSVPLPGPSGNSINTCKWTQWFNVDHPKDDPNGADLETLSNIAAHGFDVCPAPRDVSCRSVRFPYVPYKELMYNTTCGRSTGLSCLNKNNKVSPCIDYEVQFLCCPCESNPVTPTVPVTPTPHNPGNSCSNPQCTWTKWFNINRPNPGPKGGDFENVNAVISQGYSVCTAPQATECRLVRFPYIPLKELYYTQECSAAHGLVCFNKKQPNYECLDYEARFLCCTCDANN